MEEFLICLDPVTAQFYDRVARAAGRATEEVIQDALFKLAGELSLQSLARQERPN